MRGVIFEVRDLFLDNISTQQMPVEEQVGILRLCDSLIDLCTERNLSEIFVLFYRSVLQKSAFTIVELGETNNSWKKSAEYLELYLKYTSKDTSNKRLSFVAQLASELLNEAISGGKSNVAFRVAHSVHEIVTIYKSEYLLKTVFGKLLVITLKLLSVFTISNI